MRLTYSLLADSISTAKVNIDTLGNIRPIKALEESPLNPIEWSVFMSIGLVLFLFTLFLIRKIRGESIATLLPSRMDPYTWAEKEIQDLEKMGEGKPEFSRNFFVRMADILREFLFRIYNIEASKNTSSKTLKDFEEKVHPDSERFRLLETILEKADYIKFSGELPNREDTSEFTILVRKFIRRPIK